MISKYIVIFLFPLNCISQSLQVDLSLIENTAEKPQSNYYDQSKGNNNDFLNTKRSILIRYNPLTLILKSSMFFYQHSISPQLISNCQYELTCSNFSKKVIFEYGFIKGIFLTADRLMRDSPSSISDYKYFNISENNKAFDKIEYYRIR